MIRNDVKLNMAHLGDELHKARLASGYSLSQLSKCIGISPAHILRVESGEFQCNVGTLVKICGPLGIRYGALLENCVELDFAPYRETAEKELDSAPKDPRVNTPSRRRLYLLLIAESCDRTARLIRSANPAKLAQSFDCLVPEQNVLFQKFAAQVAAPGWMIGDSTGVLNDLQQTPARTLNHLGVLNAEVTAAWLAIPEKVHFHRGREEPKAEFILPPANSI